jgi:hypothetical protein
MDNKYISKGIEFYLQPAVNDANFSIEAKNLLQNITTLLSGDGYTKDASLGVLIEDLQEIGDLGTGASAERDQIEVTTLADDRHVYAEGLLVDTEFDSIDFKFLYTPTSFGLFKEVVKLQQLISAYGEYITYNILVPGLGEDKDSVFKIKGTSAIKFDGVGVNGALTMTFTVTPKEEVGFTTKAKA